MAAGWMTDGEFWLAHKRWHQSQDAKSLKRRQYEHQGRRCARCGQPLEWRDAELNLTTYDGMKAGHVTDDQANVLHRWCHKKGTYTREKMQADQGTDWWFRLLVGATDAVWRALWWAIRIVWRGLVSPF